VNPWTWRTWCRRVGERGGSLAGMSEHVPEDSVDPQSVDEADDAGGTDGAGVSGQELGEPVRTGVEEVDAVLESVEDLESRPVEEHVAVFENAHEQLRRALDGRADA